LQPVIPVFIASPNDVQEEREIAKVAVQEVSDRLSTLFGISLAPLKWENFAPISSGDAKHPQYQILQRIEHFSIFIGILYRRYGTEIVSMGNISGTEAEFNHAINNRKYIKILTYFRDQNREDMSRSDLEDRNIIQINKVQEFKNRIRDNNVTYHPYSKVGDFQSRIALDIFEAALVMILRPEDKRINDYSKFFLFSCKPTQKENSPLIVYPSIHSTRFGNENFVPNWRKHLLPTVILEDSKAIQKIESTLRLLDRHCKIVAAHSNEIDYASPGDRIWVCIGSNKYALKILKELGDKVVFEFKSDNLDDSNSREKYIAWQSKDNTNNTIVRSPLIKYLSYSERPEGEDPKWKHQYGYTYAKDYAVLARFQVPSVEGSDGESFFHYFLGGIRGLGTWGAAWYIQYRPALIAKLLNDNNTGDDVQILLEVTYRNFNIVNVKDVSNESQDFFDLRFSDEYIKQKYEDEMSD
jgi:hypothetical protein